MKKTRALSIRRAPPSKGRAASGAWVRAPLPALLGVSRFWLLSKRTACAHVPVSRWRLGFTPMQPRSACRLHLAFPIGVRGRAGVGTSGPEHALLQPPPREGEPAQVPSEPHPGPLRAASESLPPAIFLVVVALCPPESYPLSHLPPNKSKRGEARPLISFNKKGGSHANTVGPAAGRLLVHAPPKHPAPRPASLLEGGHRCAPLCPLQGWVFSLKVKSLSHLKNGVSF